MLSTRAETTPRFKKTSSVARGDATDYSVPISAERLCKIASLEGMAGRSDDVTALSLNPAGVAADDRYRRSDGWLLPLAVRGDCHFPTHYVKPLLFQRRVIQTMRSYGFILKIRSRPVIRIEI